MRRLYFVCDDGHYFTGQGCPFDGWGDHADFLLARSVEEDAVNRELPLTIELLRASGVSEDLLRRVFIVEFGGDEPLFTGIAPEYLVVKGKYKRVSLEPSQSLLGREDQESD